MRYVGRDEESGLEILELNDRILYNVKVLGCKCVGCEQVILHLPFVPSEERVKKGGLLCPRCNTFKYRHPDFTEIERESIWSEREVVWNGEKIRVKSAFAHEGFIVPATVDFHPQDGKKDKPYVRTPFFTITDRTGKKLRVAYALPLVAKHWPLQYDERPGKMREASFIFSAVKRDGGTRFESYLGLRKVVVEDSVVFSIKEGKRTFCVYFERGDELVAVPVHTLEEQEAKSAKEPGKVLDVTNPLNQLAILGIDGVNVPEIKIKEDATGALLDPDVHGEKALEVTFSVRKYWEVLSSEKFALTADSDEKMVTKALQYLDYQNSDDLLFGKYHKVNRKPPHYKIIVQQLHRTSRQQALDAFKRVAGLRKEIARLSAGDGKALAEVNALVERLTAANTPYAQAIDEIAAHIGGYENVTQYDADREADDDSAKPKFADLERRAAALLNSCLLNQKFKKSRSRKPQKDARKDAPKAKNSDADTINAIVETIQDALTIGADIESLATTVAKRLEAVSPTEYAMLYVGDEPLPLEDLDTARTLLAASLIKSLVALNDKEDAKEAASTSAND